MIMDLWAINEERLQFVSDTEYKHDVSKELGLFQQLKELYGAKIEKMSRFDEKKKSAFAFEQNFNRATQGTDLLQKIQMKMREEEAVPEVKKEAKKEEGKASKSTPITLKPASPS